MNETDEFILEHFGTKGMKWGVRRGRKQTGLTRHRGAVIDRNARGIRNANKALKGEKYKVSMALGRAFMGKEANDRRLRNNIKDAKKQSDRLKKGKLTIEDRLDLYASVSLADLVVSRTPR